MDKKFKNQNKTEIVKLLASLTHLGYIMITPLILGVLGGNWLDGYLNSSPLWLIIGVIVGIGASFRNLYAYFKKFNK